MQHVFERAGGGILQKLLPLCMTYSTDMRAVFSVQLESNLRACISQHADEDSLKLPRPER